MTFVMEYVIVAVSSIRHNGGVSMDKKYQAVLAQVAYGILALIGLVLAARAGEEAKAAGWKWC